MPKHLLLPNVPTDVLQIILKKQFDTKIADKLHRPFSMASAVYKMIRDYNKTFHDSPSGSTKTNTANEKSKP